MIEKYHSLRDATRASFPPAFSRLVAVHEHGDVGFALFDTGPAASAPYLYEVFYDRRDGRWSEGSSSNGPGWHRTDDDTKRGVVTAWGDAPRNADRVRVEFGGAVREVSVVNGAYVLLWWDIPCPAEGDFPRLSAIRVMGEWI